MRNAFAAEIAKLASEDPRVVLLSGDIGNRLFDQYRESFPDRFYNCGVAEANMASMAAGMAMTGLRPITYTITPFNTTRCLEQIRVDICYHHLPVIVVGVGGGLSYAELGATHHSCEDISFLRSLPTMKVMAPCDPIETRLALRAALAQNDPCYIRIGKKGEPALHASEPDFKLGRALVLRAAEVKSKEIYLLACGTIASVALETANFLEKTLGKTVNVMSFHTVKPLDEAFLRKAFGQGALVATIEEHSLIGGLGSAVAEWKADQGIEGPAAFLRFGTRDEFMHGAGKQKHARAYYGLTVEKISEKITERLQRTNA